MDDPDKRAQIANFVSGILETRGLQEVPRDQKHDVAVRVWIALKDRQTETTFPPAIMGEGTIRFGPELGGIGMKKKR